MVYFFSRSMGKILRYPKYSLLPEFAGFGLGIYRVMQDFVHTYVCKYSWFWGMPIWLPEELFTT